MSTRSYTARELERETGFSRRTIAYYVQIGLLPRVGRRGPKTRYPKRVRDRLLFIRRVREAEQAGAVRATSLREIGAVFEGSTPELVEGVAEGRISVTADLLSLPPGPVRMTGAAHVYHGATTLAEFPHAPPDAAFSPPRARRDMLEERFVLRERDPGWPGEEPADAEVAALLATLREVADRRDLPESEVETWCRVEIAPGVVLSVRDVTDEDAALLDAVGRSLRRLISDRFGYDSTS